MRTDTPAPIQLADYRPFPFAIDAVELTFDLAPDATRVRARLTVTRTGEADAPLVLDGVRLKLVSVAIDDVPVAHDRMTRTDEHLTLHAVPDQFVLTTEVQIDPAGNTALEGLYMSGGRFCTQCESEGFRKITYFPDRPDVLTTYRVRIEADRAFAHLLSNGNLLEHGPLPGGRHFAVWSDPFRKPCYLFALVAGELDVLRDSFVTASGREVQLAIYVDPGQSQRAAYAMDALKRSMRWDEEAFGREYDLDLFMIVAVRDFNFGAMENKGLNIFNSSLLLADEATATDADFERIESVVAHEYFHNWTGNRITCRDWFQLCLKEGLTVFRDQSFSGDMRGEAVQRIKDVKMLRARQFPEDAGPMAHPVRPSSYLKIDNFYTATIYEKGAEVIRMLKTLIGAEAFRAGMDLYFERWDGHATTVEAFLECFAEASGRDLSGFFRWYEQAGTPSLDIRQAHDAATETLTLTLTQSLRATPGQPDKVPVPIPVRIGLLDSQGAKLPSEHGGTRATEHLLVLDEASRSFTLTGVSAPPVLSALRGFSAPVRLSTDAAATDGYVLMAADRDLFNRWEAGQVLARGLILRRAAGHPDETGEARFADALGRAVADETAGDAFRALMLGLPSEADLAMEVEGPVDPTAIHDAREALRMRISAHLAGRLRAMHTGLQMAESFSPDAAQAGRRALRNAVLDLIVALPDSDAIDRAVGHFNAASNMTDQMGGLAALTLIGGTPLDQALQAFYQRWENEPLVIDKWFAIQARSPAPDALGRVLGLTAHPDFDSRNPNRLRALVQGFSIGNPYRFHGPEGDGYRFLADQIIATDPVNPSVAARLIEPFANWARLEPGRSRLMQAALERIIAHPGLSKNVLEVASRAIGR
jgi:aminopeptidase N